jgi:hypothetical protein
MVQRVVWRQRGTCEMRIAHFESGTADLESTHTVLKESSVAPTSNWLWLLAAFDAPGVFHAGLLSEGVSPRIRSLASGCERRFL